MNKWTIFRQGVFEELPLQLGVFPFGIIYGIMAIESGLTPLQSFLMSSIIFGGASQIVFVQLISSSSSIPIILTSITAINSRHFLYSLSMYDFLIKLKLKWRIILAYLLTDEAYAVSIRKFMKEPNNSLLRYHLLGTGLTLFTSWQMATLTGILLGGNLPQFLDLSFIIPLTFLAIIVPMINSISTLCAVLSSGLSSLYFRNLELSLWILLAGTVGLFVGFITRKLDKKE